ncbi:hypothetical protein RHGRI_003606 [Rhododendron griersonianum]|uniref:Uncharacterized protein n=1 Tax=Rhododendron griersonianum TaxID=479676 RepID=A0AAV6L6G5_9ERIC|nr:hypothetical protein RHGRI_003606 [Rhododendron griersonianum]
MVMQYQGSNQSMDDPPQNQEDDDIVDPAPYLAGDSALLQQQQQLRKNWSEASDWRPRGGGIMRMNNQGFEESNMGFEESMEMTTCFYFPPSPTNFPLYLPMPSVFSVSSDQQENISLALSYRHILEDKSGALHVLYKENKFDDLHTMAMEAGVLPDDVDSLVYDILDAVHNEREVTIRRINWLEQKDEDNVDQPVFEVMAVVQQLIQNRGGELDVILGGGVFTLNGLEVRDCQDLPTTPETLHICRAKLSFRVWLGHGGQWAAEGRYRYNSLNIGSFTTVEDAMSAYEVVIRLSGRADLTRKAPKDLHNLIVRESDGIDVGSKSHVTFNWEEGKNIALLLVFETVGVAQQLIQNRGGELDVILGGGVYMINGLECRDSQGLPTTPETKLICPISTLAFSQPWRMPSHLMSW